MKSSHCPFAEGMTKLHFTFSHKYENVIVSENLEPPHVIHLEICPKNSINDCCEVRNVTNITHDTNKVLQGSDLQVSLSQEYNLQKGSFAQGNSYFPKING